jgi:hypothetical protein
VDALVPTALFGGIGLGKRPRLYPTYTRRQLADFSYAMEMDLDIQQLTETIGEEYSILIEGEPVLALVLREVEALPPPPEDTLAQFPDMRRQPLSLLFEMPEGYFVSQNTYRLRHQTLGESDFFLVPVEAGAYLQSVIS